MKTVLVLPTVRETNFILWVKKWQGLLDGIKVIVVEDNPTRGLKIPSDNFDHFSWKEIDKQLGKASWIIPRRTAAIRSFGLYKAYQENADMIITVDDDCYPISDDFVQRHEYYLFEHQYTSRWLQHSQGLRVRGFPESVEKMETVVNMGLWANIPDLDGEMQKRYPDYRTHPQQFNFFVPHGYYAPISSMNLALKNKVVPALYFLLMGPSYPFDRFDDIWSGLFFIKICHHLGVYVGGGEPFIWHDRASNVDDNIRKEASGKLVNEYLWRDINKIELNSQDFRSCYIELAKSLPRYDNYWDKLAKAMNEWAHLF